ncbi:MAG: tetratricopeptide repeat protein [Erythrobacter sp.]
MTFAMPIRLSNTLPAPKFVSAIVLAASLSLSACDTAPANPFAAAQESFAAGEPRTAMTFASEALSQDPNDPEIRMLIAEISMALGNPDRAIAELQKVDAGSEHSALAQIRLADAYFAAGKLERAAEILQPLEQHTALSHSVAIGILLAQGKIDPAFDRLSAALADFPDDARLIAMDAQRLWMSARREEAMTRLAPILNSDSVIFEAHVLAGQMRLSERSLDQAKAHFSAVLKSRPTHQTAMLALAAIARDQGEDEEARNWIAKVHNVGPAHPVAQLFAAQIAYDSGDFQQAYELIEQVPPAFLRRPQFSRLRGFIETARGQRATAIVFLQDYLEDSDGDPLARRVLAENLAAQNRFEEAWDVIAPVVDHPLADGGSLLLALRLAEQTGQGDAQQIGQQLARREATPSIAAPMRDAGLAIRAGDWAEADRIYSPLINGDGKNDPALLNNAAAVKIKLGEHGAAIALGRRALALAPSSPEILDTLGWALWQNGKRGEARALLSQAREGAPNNREIAEHLAIANAAS